MDKRLELQEIFEEILGSKNVYFQPPHKMNYPCIKYQLLRNWKQFANDKSYLKRRCYTVTIIDYDPDSSIPDKIEQLPYCSFDRSYASDNLNHWVFTIYY